MNGLNVVGLTLMALVLIFLMLRVERRVVWLVLLLLVLPAGLAVARWSSTGGHWPETWLSLAIAAVLAAAWWIIVGRRLPRPSSDAIHVWGQEKLPKLKPDEGRALKAENERLREHNEELEAELRRLKGGSNGGPPPATPPSQN